jgi:single-stranded-DNA-specific exonuclease
MPRPQWQIQPPLSLPDWFMQSVRRHTGELSGHYLAQLLWQRGLREPADLAGFLNPAFYHPTSPFEFGEEMHWAVQRLQQAQQQQETIAIWGDFDADGITATAVLWEGLGAIFPHEQLTYYIPNRFTESHGLSKAGIDLLAASGCTLIVTCDTGSTDAAEIAYAQASDIDVIITDHHTLPIDRPPVTAIINPRALPPEHPLANLSGVAVAYKLVEAFYDSLPQPPRTLDTLLDLVAIGLVSDLAQLTGDCRYLAQRGIDQLQQHANQPLSQSSRPGIAKLLELCKRNGDRPTDISFGLGPRINAISRIHGDARFCVELLTSRDRDRCQQLAEETELANTRRKSLQKDLVQQVKSRLAQLDLSTCHVIVLADSQWSLGLLGLVAGQIAQEYGRPTILLSLEETDLDTQPVLARGSARSINHLNLYELVQQQAHLLHRCGGHPLALGLSLPVENIPLFTDAINRQLRQTLATVDVAETVLQADLTVTVAELGKELFRELKLLEPCGIGNPAPKLLIQNCWFQQVRNRNIQDHRGRKVRYIKTEFELWDDSATAGFPGVWWEHYRDEIPTGLCDAIVELDFNTYKKCYEVRLLSVRSAKQPSHLAITTTIDWILDWRAKAGIENPIAPLSLPFPLNHPQEILQITQCPTSWSEMQHWFGRVQAGQKLALAYAPPNLNSPIERWQQLVGIAKYLSRTGTLATRSQLQNKLALSDRALAMGLETLQYLGFKISLAEETVQIGWSAVVDEKIANGAIAQFFALLEEEQFYRRYFYEVPLATIQSVAHQFLQSRGRAIEG